jgi:hypothetical protein
MSVDRLSPVGRVRAVHLSEGGPHAPKSLTIEYSDRCRHHLSHPAVLVMEATEERDGHDYP